MNEEIKDAAITLLQTLINATGAELEDERLAIQIIAKTMQEVVNENNLLQRVSGSALSKDYEKLYDRIRNSEHVAVWVDCDWHDGTITRDIAAVKRFDYADIHIGARGIEYGSIRKWKLENKTEKQAFIDECERLKLEFI